MTLLGCENAQKGWGHEGVCGRSSFGDKLEGWGGEESTEAYVSPRTCVPVVLACSAAQPLFT